MDAPHGHSNRPRQKCSSKDSSDLTIEHVASSSEGRQVQNAKKRDIREISLILRHIPLVGLFLFLFMFIYMCLCFHASVQLYISFSLLMTTQNDRGHKFAMI